MSLLTLDVWPRLGTTVTLASGFVITAAGAETTATDEIMGLLRSYRLLTWDPTFANPNPSPIPPASEGSITAGSASSLNTVFGTANAVATLLGYYGPADQGGGDFAWVTGSTESIDNAMCMGDSSRPGRWLRLIDGSHVNPKWFGARGDGVTNDTAAFVAARNYALASGIREIRIPAGTFILNPGAVEAFLTCSFVGSGRGTTILKSSSATPLSGTDQGVLNITTFVHTVTIKDLSIDGSMDVASWNPLVPYVGGRVHGVYSLTGGFDIRYDNIFAYNCTGAGFRDDGAFQYGFEKCWAQNCRMGGFWLKGGSALSLHRCAGGGFDTGKALFIVEGGSPQIENCNGLFGWSGKSYTPGTEPKNSWAQLGASSACKATIRNCNIEYFTEYGIFCYGSATVNMDGVQFIHGQPQPRRAIHWVNVEADDAPVVSNSCSVTLLGSATWGDPTTGVTDGKPFYINGGAMGFFAFNRKLGNDTAKNATGNIDFPFAYSGVNYFQSPALMLSSTQTDFPGENYVTLTSNTNLSDTYSGVSLDASGGAFQVNLPLIGQSLRRPIHFTVKTASVSNTITLQGYDDGVNKQPIVSTSRGGSNTAMVLDTPNVTITLVPGAGGIAGGGFSWFVQE